MATYYTSEREEFNLRTDEILSKIQELEKVNRDLNIALMRKSTEASEAAEELKRCKLEWEIVADQGCGHNSCHAAVSKALKITIGHTGKWPDPENVTSEQFAQGCVAWHGGLFPNCGVKLVVIKSDQK